MVRCLKNPFSLLEICVVLLVISMVVALSVPMFRGTPSRVSLRDTADRIREVFASASRRASVTGREVSISYTMDPASGLRVFSLVGEGGADPSVPPFPVPAGTEVVFPREYDPQSGAIVFKFLPDGTGSGPRFTLGLDGCFLRLTLSPLTGTVGLDEPDAKEVEEDAQK